MVCIHVVKKEVFQKTNQACEKVHTSHPCDFILSHYLLQFAEICGLPWKSYHSLSVRWGSDFDLVITTPWLFWHSVVDFLLSLGSLSRCMIPFQPSFSCRTDGLRFDCKIFLHTEEFMLHGCKVHRPCGCKTNPNPYTPTTVLGSWYQVLVLTCCFFKKHLHLDWAINGHHLLFIIMPEHVVIVTCSRVMWLSPFMLDLSANSEVSDSECFECFCTLNCRNAGVTLVHAGSDHSAADVRDRHQSAV